MTVLIVAGCNSKPGLLSVNTITRDVCQINEMDVRGLVVHNDYIFFLTKKGLWRKPPGGDAKLISDIVNDWHGLMHHDNRLWGVDPVSDTIVEWDMTGKFICRWHWKKDPKAGRLHTNDIQVDPSGSLWQCCFTYGICREGEPMQYGAHTTPHSILFHDSHQPYWCASNRGQVMHADAVVAEWSESFTRGLCSLDRHIVVGLSTKRNGAGGTCAQLKAIDLHGDEGWTIDLPVNEVYSIARVRGT